jgi:uncharacterized protein with HEPN domain
MRKSNRIYLEDIIRAIDLITEKYVFKFSFKEFDKDKKTQDAVIRQVAIIGEAMGRFDKIFVKNNPELPFKEAVAMRNILVHDYDWVDTAQVWKTIKKDLPKLRKIVKQILKQEK